MEMSTADDGWIEVREAQPTRELTDEQIMDALREMFKHPRWPSTAIDAGRAIERLVRGEES
jgi:hypothetical protein